METVIYLYLVIASVSFTVSEVRAFLLLLEWAKRRSSFLGGLLSCGYCFGHWVAFGLAVIYQPQLFEAWWLLDCFLTALVIAWLGTFQWLGMC